MFASDDISDQILKLNMEKYLLEYILVFRHFPAEFFLCNFLCFISPLNLHSIYKESIALLFVVSFIILIRGRIVSSSSLLAVSLTFALYYGET